eukprot:s3902_g10.t1
MGWQSKIALMVSQTSWRISKVRTVVMMTMRMTMERMVEIGDQDGGSKSKKKIKHVNKAEQQEDEFDRVMRECDERLAKEAEDNVEVVDGPPLPPPDEKLHDKPPSGMPPDGEIEHHSAGKPSDRIIYLNDIGEYCKLGSKGRHYRVGADGRKDVRHLSGPKGEFNVEEWKNLSAKERDVIIRREKLEEEAEKLKEIKAKKEKEKKEKAEKAKLAKEEKEKKKAEASSSKEEPKKKKRKKKDKPPAEGDGGDGKDGGKDAGIFRGEWVSLSTAQDLKGLDRARVGLGSVVMYVARRRHDPKEMLEDPDAKASMRTEWLGQHKQGVFDFSVVREYDDVVNEAKRLGKEVHMARVHGICVEKNYQLPKGSPGRKFKGRGVLLGNQVKNQHWETAFFQMVSRGRLLWLHPRAWRKVG